MNNRSRVALIIGAIVLALPALAFADTFTTDLGYGDTGPDVVSLQQFLTAQGDFSVAVTGNFFALTLAAVQAFQTANGITPASGFWGPVTRAVANQLISNGASTGTTVATINSSSQASEDQILLQEIQQLEAQIAQLKSQVVVNTSTNTNTNTNTTTASSYSCTLGGSTVANGDSAVFYDTQQPNTGDTCSAHATTRYCVEGNLFGDSKHVYSSCTNPGASTSTTNASTNTSTSNTASNTSASNSSGSTSQGASTVCTQVDNVTDAQVGWGCSSDGPAFGLLGIYLGDLHITTSSACVQVIEPGDPYTGTNYFCTRGGSDIGMQWSYAGALPGYYCALVDPPGEPTSYGWYNNYLCEPTIDGAYFTFVPNSSGVPTGHAWCVLWNEPADSYWGSSNYMCGDWGTPPSGWAGVPSATASQSSGGSSGSSSQGSGGTPPPLFIPFTPPPGGGGQQGSSKDSLSNVATVLTAVTALLQSIQQSLLH